MQTDEGSLTDLQSEVESLRSQLRLWKVGADHLHHGLCICDEDGRLVFCNRRYLEILEVPAELAQPGVRVRDLVRFSLGRRNPTGKSVEDIFAEFNSQRGKGESFRAQLTRDGKTYNVCHSVTPGGYWVATFEDVTAQVHAQEALRLGEERLRLVHEVTGLADFESGADGLSTCSARFFEQLGLPVSGDAISPDEWVQVVHPDDREKLNSAVLKALQERREWFSFEFRILQADSGELRWISCRTMLQRNDAGDLVRTIGAHLDVTERKRADEALREGEERFRLAAEAAGLGVWDYDIASDKRLWSDRLREILGMSADVVPNIAPVLDCIDPADRADFVNQVDAFVALERPGTFQTAFRIRRADSGEERWIIANGWKALRWTGDPGRIIISVRDATEEKTAEERVRWAASHDVLTGLANRALFQEKLDEAVRGAGHKRASAGLLLLDLDRFKQVNDTLGHDAGDSLLRMIAERLQRTVRSTDTIARLGGDEFAIILPELKCEERLGELAEAVLDRLREPFVFKGSILDCKASIGGAIYPQHGSSTEDLLQNADTALYASKSAGRGICTIFHPQLRAKLQLRSSMLRLAAEALNRDRVVPYYQPKLSLIDGSLVGFEALLRWRDSAGRIRLPGLIESAFEDLDLAASISDRVIERAIADMRRWLDAGVPFQHVAVNASAAEFRRDNFAERVLDQLERADVPTSHFQLEVTETVFLGRGAEYVHRALALLSSRGVKIALDDFGTGYASLRHLKQFPVDLIKIDRSFVRDMHVDAGDDAIVRAVINLGRSLGIKVVAEGIETHEQAARLVELECDFGQGFLFAKALPAKRVPSLVRTIGGARSEQPRRRRSPRLRLVASAG